MENPFPSVKAGFWDASRRAGRGSLSSVEPCRDHPQLVFGLFSSLLLQYRTFHLSSSKDNRERVKLLYLNQQMASTQALSAAAQDRKARLAQLKSLKRKQPDESQEQSQDDERLPKSPRHEADPQDDDESKSTNKYLSGRNYDFETKGARLGFETAPMENKDTLERRAEALAAETKRQAEEEKKADEALDLFKLQPKKPNWDLKRDLERKLEVLNVRTDNAIARMVRERIAKQREAVNGNGEGGDGEIVGMEGTTLVEATNVREREDEEERLREQQEDEALLDVS